MEPTRAIATLGEFAIRWAEQPHALAMVRPHVFGRPSADGVRMQVVTRDATRVIVRTPQ